MRKRKPTLESELLAILIKHCGERGDNEGAAETLKRIIKERDGALGCLYVLNRILLPHTNP